MAREITMLKFDMSSLKFTNNGKWASKSMLWLAVSCGALLFMPSKLVGMLRLDGFISDYAHFIGLGLIVAVAFQLTRVINYALDLSIAHLTTKRMEENIAGKVNLLDPAERALLREFFLQGSTKLTLPKDEIAVMALVKSQILECLGNEKHYAIQGPTAEYKISMKAREYLNRQVLRLPAGEPSKEEMQQLIRNRPQFVGGMAPQRKQAA